MRGGLSGSGRAGFALCGGIGRAGRLRLGGALRRPGARHLRLAVGVAVDLRGGLLGLGGLLRRGLAGLGGLRLCGLGRLRRLRGRPVRECATDVALLHRRRGSLDVDAGVLVGSQPPLREYDTQQLRLLADAATADAATFGCERGYWPPPPCPSRSASVTAVWSMSSCAVRSTSTESMSSSSNSLASASAAARSTSSSSPRSESASALP